MRTIYTRAVAVAEQLVGGEDALATVLGVSPTQFKDWSSGRSTPPRGMILLLTDLILDETGDAAPSDEAAAIAWSTSPPRWR